MFRSCWTRILVLMLLCSMLPVTARASYTDNPPAQPGFTHAPKLSGDDTGYGRQLNGAAIGRSSPAIAEIDGNPGNGKEIAVGGTDGILHVYHSDGSLAWQQQVAPPCPVAKYPDGMINSTPAVGSLFGDGVPYVVVGYGHNLNYQGQCPEGGVAAYDGRTGAERWRYRLANPGEQLHGVFSSPGLADIDGDGTLEVGFGTLERDIYILNENGTKRWRFHNKDTVISSPAFADVDGNGLLDMIIGSDISANPNTKPPTQDGGYVTAFRGTDSKVLWRRFFDQVIYSSPAIADLDGNGTQEVIIGTGCYFDRSRGNFVMILNARDGADVRRLNADGCINASPAIGDINGNGKLDIVAMVDGSRSGQATVTAWEYDTPSPIWRTAPGTAIEGANETGLFNDVRSPVIADVDGNGSLEVLAVNFGDVVIYNGADGRQLTCNKCRDSTRTLFSWHPLAITPAVADLDGDGDLEVVAGGTHSKDPNRRGYLYAWTNLAGIGSSGGNAGANRAPWPLFRSSPTNFGAFGTTLRPGISSLTLPIERRQGAVTLPVALLDPAGIATSWSASVDQSWLSVRPERGSLPARVDLTINPAGLADGTYEGLVQLRSPAGPATVSVRIIVVEQFHRRYLPLTVDS